MEKENAIHLITYGNQPYFRSLNRLKSEANRTEWFKSITLHKPKDFGKDFLEINKNFLKQNRRGNGYWIWKPYFIWKNLNKLKDGEFLIYVDAGCVLNKSGEKRFKEYLNIAKEKYEKDGSGWMCFHLPKHLVGRWTKGDTLEYFGFRNNKKILTHPQHVGGIQIIYNCKKAREIAKEWYETCCKHHLLDDSKSKTPNTPDFKQHRHDQAIFTLVCIKHGVEGIPDETYFAPNWNVKGKDFPIHARRKK